MGNAAKNSINVFIFGTSDGITYQPTEVYVGIGVDGTKKNSELNFENEAERNNYYMKIDIRNDLLNYFSAGGTLDRETILGIVSTHVDNTFVRQEMATFEKLRYDVVPRNGWIIFMFVALVVADVILKLNLANNDY